MQIIDADGHINDHICGDEIAPLYNEIEVSVCTLFNTKQDGTGRSPLGPWRPFCSMDRPIVAPKKLEQLPGLTKPASYARLSYAGA